MPGKVLKFDVTLAPPGYHFNMVFRRIVESKLEDTLQAVNTVAQKANIICFSDTCTMNITKLYAKQRVLCEDEFFIVCKLVKYIVSELQTPCSTPNLSRIGPIRVLSHIYRAKA